VRLENVRMIDLDSEDNVEYDSITPDLVDGVSEWVMDLDKVVMYRKSPKLEGVTDVLFSQIEISVPIYMDFDNFDRLMRNDG
jgi:hypothetical protein